MTLSYAWLAADGWSLCG